MPAPQTILPAAPPLHFGAGGKIPGMPGDPLAAISPCAQTLLMVCALTLSEDGHGGGHRVH